MGLESGSIEKVRLEIGVGEERGDGLQAASIVSVG